MSQCVPNWDLDDGLPHHPTTTTGIHAPMAEYVVSELTWEKGHLARHGFDGGPLPRVGKLAQKRPSPGAPSWEKGPLANGTLEAVVDQATRAPVPAVADALVPSSEIHPDAGEPEHQPRRAVRSSFAGGGSGRCGGSCGGRKRPRPPGAGDGSRSATGSTPSVGLAFDACEINGEEAGFATSASLAEEGSPETENASYARALTAVSEGDDSCYSRDSQDGSDEEEKSKNEKGRSSAFTKRIRAAAVHNQSERKRRDRINQRMRTLQKLVPNSSKTDKASILDEVIDYMKQLQAQVQVMSRMSSMPHMMMPMAMQQLQMAMMTQMAQMAQMGMAMGMGAMADLGQSGMPWPPFLPPSASRVDVPARDPMQAPAGALPLDPFAAYMAFQAQQPMNMEVQSRMAALYQQQHQQPPGPSNET